MDEDGAALEVDAQLDLDDSVESEGLAATEDSHGEDAECGVDGDDSCRSSKTEQW